MSRRGAETQRKAGSGSGRLGCRGLHLDLVEGNAEGAVGFLVDAGHGWGRVNLSL
jgi:hypothetical protein